MKDRKAGIYERTESFTPFSLLYDSDIIMAHVALVCKDPNSLGTYRWTTA